MITKVVHMITKLVAALIVAAAVAVPTQVNADHDKVYAPCDPNDDRPLYEQVWFIDYQSGEMLRFDDPWWAESAGSLTNWGHQCRLGTTGVWQAAPILPLPHPPTYEPETRSAPATTTTAAPIPTTAAVPVVTQPVPVVEPAATGYDLFDAEWDGYPFEATVVLLEERYPPGTPGRHHFRLSVAVEFLREGGMVRGLDNLWESAS